MKAEKNNNNSFNKYYINRTEYKSNYTKSIISKYLKSKKLLTNSKNNNILKNNILLNNNNTDSEEIIPKNPNGIKYKKLKYVSKVNNKSKDNISPNITNENWRKKEILQDFSTKNKLIKIKNQKIRRRILDSETYNIRNNHLSFNKTSYQINKFINNYSSTDEEPFLINDKNLSNSIIINHDDQIQNYRYNNIYSENSSKLLAKDLPSSLNNTQRYANSKFYEKNKNKSQDNSDVLITFRKKEFNYNKDNNKTIEAEKMTKPRTILKFNNLRNYNNKRAKRNLSYNDYDIEFDNVKNFNSRFINNFSNSPNLNSNNLNSINSINSLENNINAGNSNSTSNQNSKKISLIMPKIKTKGCLKDILFNIRNSKKNNRIYDYTNQNNKLFDKKYSYSHDENWKNFDNHYLNSSKKNPEIESCIISFKNSKEKKKEGEKITRLNNSENKENKTIKYIKKKIIGNKNSNSKKFSLRKRFIFNDEENNSINNYTSYKVYKKPYLSISQNMKANVIQLSNADKYLAYSHFNILDKNNIENKIKDFRHSQDNFYKRKYIGTKYMKHNNKAILPNDNFRKKEISPFNKYSNYTENINNSSMNNTPIYSKKSPTLFRKLIKPNLLENLFSNNYLSNTHSYIKNKNRIYLKTSNGKINSTYKLFNSQIINIKNNIFNNNNNFHKTEFINNTPFGEKILIAEPNIKKIKVNKMMKSTVINKFSFITKYYNYYMNRPKVELQRIGFNRKYIKKKENIMKKNIIPISFYTKKSIKIYQIPKISNFYCTKITRLKFKNKSNKKKKENKEENNEINIKETCNNQNLFKETKIYVNINQKKLKNCIERNNDNKLKYDSKLIKDENIIRNDRNKNSIKIKVLRKSNKPKISKYNNYEKDKEMNNIQKIRLNETELPKGHRNDIESFININQSEIINYPKIVNSPETPIKSEKNNNNNYINTDKKKELTISNKKVKLHSYLRKRSSSFKVKNKRIIKVNENNNLFKVRLPNSEARKKKFKITIVKRIKVKYKNNFCNFSEEKILINNCNNDIKEESNIIKKYKSQRKSQKETDKEKKIMLIIKEDLENYILFSLKNIGKKDMLINNYNFSIIGQLLIKEKIDLSNLLKIYLKISFDIIDSKDKIFISNDYINNIIEKYKRTYLNKNNFIQIHEEILEILIDIIINSNKKDETKYKFDIIGALFHSLLYNELFFVSDLNIFINCEDQIYINIAKIVRCIILYSKDDKFKSKYFDIFKNSKIFFNNPIYFKYVTKYLKLMNAKYYDD